MRLLCNLDDEELLRLLKDDDESALAGIYKKYWDKLYVSAHAVLRDGQACEDIIQEIFLKLWLNRSVIHIQTSLASYLYASVRYAVYRQIKSGRVREDLFDHVFERIQAGPDYDNLEYKELNLQINALVDRLPEKCRAIYRLSREQHLSHKQIAAQLNISPKTVENHLTKALSFLRVSLGQVLTVELLFILFKK
jgi:RNA polymerase sigma-70 factor (ECF subfamily)